MGCEIEWWTGEELARLFFHPGSDERVSKWKHELKIIQGQAGLLLTSPTFKTLLDASFTSKPVREYNLVVMGGSGTGKSCLVSQASATTILGPSFTGTNKP